MRDLQELLVFLTKKMSMTEIYQPVIILHLLERGGIASKADLARTLSGYDESVQEYYERILMRWPKTTLTKHEVVTYDRKSKAFSLNFNLGDTHLLRRAKTICEEKIKEWMDKRSVRSDVPKAEASRRYRVLKAARGKCELCGISSKLMPLHIDHIVPRTKADRQGYIVKDGIRMHVDDERNLQALCFRCNTAKRDQDSTDFRLPAKKLVRDRIPEIIRVSGRTPVTKQLKGKQLESQLFEKLTEEHAELLANTSMEEILDMIELLLSIAKGMGYTEEETLDFLHRKRDTHGSFDTGTFLLKIVASVRPNL